MSAGVILCLGMEPAAVLQPPATSSHSQKLFCNTLAMVARPEYLASGVGGSPQKHPALERSWKLEGSIPRTGQRGVRGGNRGIRNH